MYVCRSVDIEAPPERVWPLLVEPEDVRKWYPSLRTYQYEDAGRRGSGAHVYAEEKAAGPLMKLHFEISDWVENRSVGLHLVSGTGVRGYDQHWTLEPTVNGTRFTFEESVTLPYGILGRLVGAIGQRTSDTHVVEMLTTLKALAEAGSPA